MVDKNVFIVCIVILVAAVIGFAPLGIIWTINTLFGLDTPCTLKTWFAALVLFMLWTHPSGIQVR